MGNKKVIVDKIKKEMCKSSKLKSLSFDINLPFDRAMEMRDKQEEAFKKVEFFKELNKAMKN